MAKEVNQKETLPKSQTQEVIAEPVSQIQEQPAPKTQEQSAPKTQEQSAPKTQEPKVAPKKAETKKEPVLTCQEFCALDKGSRVSLQVFRKTFVLSSSISENKNAKPLSEWKKLYSDFLKR